MARCNFVKKAQKDIYANGLRVEYLSTKGKRAGQTLTKTDRTQPRDEKDTVIVKAGEAYYWWQFKNAPKKYSKTRPRPSQLTQSDYLSRVYGFSEQIEDFDGTTAEELREFVENLKSEVEELKDETEEKLGNMPDSLQESPTGQLLQERIDQLEAAYDELDSLYLDDYEDPDEDELKEEIAEEEEIELDEVPEDLLERAKAEKESDWVAEKMEEINQICFN